MLGSLFCHAQGVIKKLEYFIDKDPGLGKGVSVSITSADTLTKAFEVNTDKLNLGLHWVYVRVLTDSGIWSAYQYFQFNIEDTVSQGPISQLEYFIDKDTSIGKMKHVSISDVDTLNTVIRHDIAGLSSGQHFVHVRTKNKKGTWSPYLFHAFIIEDTVPEQTYKITKIETSIDSSLHLKSRIQTTTYNPPVDSINQIFTRQIDTGLSLLSPHYLRIWAQNNTGLTSPWHKDSFIVINCPMLDTAAFITSGKFCIGETISFKQDITKFGVWPKDSFYFTWYINDCCTTFSTKDSFSTSFSSSGQIDVRFIYEKKTESRCKNEITKSFIIGTQYNDTIQKSICDNDSLKIHGIFRKSAGKYTLNTSSILGCDSISVVQLNLNKTYSSTSQRQVCSGDSSFVFGTWKKTSGLYSNKLATINGCDSVLNLNLIVNPVYALKDSFTICKDDSAVVHGKTFKTAGNYNTNFKTKGNCDSSYFTTIMVNPSYQLKDTFTICQGDSILKHGKKFKTSGNFNSAFKTNKNCDSSYSTLIKVNPTYSFKDTFTFCNGDSVLKHGKKFKTAGTFTTAFKTNKNCDSIYTTLIRVNPVYNLRDSFTICSGDSVTVHGKIFKTAGTFNTSFKTKNACDSIYTTKIKVNPSYKLRDNFMICQGDSVLVHGKKFKTAGSFTTAFKTSRQCDSIYTTDIQVNPIYTLKDTFTICNGDSVLKHGKKFKIAGDFKTSFKTSKGCDSIYLTKIHVLLSYNLKDSFTICQGDSLRIHGKLFKVSGLFKTSFKTNKGCDSSYSTKIIVNPSYSITRILGLCGGDSVLFNFNYRKVTGTYIGNFKTNKNCDSIITLKLTVDNIINVSQNIEICEKDSFLLNGRFIKTAGLYIDTLTARLGCDSVTKTTLIVNPLKTTNLQTSICSTDSILFGGKFLKTAGNYVNVLKSNKNCDSTVTLNLTVKPAILTRLNVKICTGDSIFTGNRFKKTAGVFVDVLKAKNLCDSTVETTVGILAKSTSTQNALICFNDSIRINGKFERRSGTYNFKVKNKVGCDSSVTFNLAIRPPANLSIVATGFSTLTTNKPFVSYQWLRNEVIISGAIQRSINVTLPGVYDVEIVDSLGCRISTIDLRKLDISELFKQVNYTVFPNPASQLIRVLNDNSSPFKLRLVNNLGQKVFEAEAELGYYTINIESIPDGLYYLHVSDGVRLIYHKVVISK